MGEGSVVICDVLDASLEFPQNPKKMQDHLYSERFACPVDNLSLPEIEPRTFSFNSPHGACPKCTGLGYLRKVDEELIINPNLSILEGAILPCARTIESNTWSWRTLETVASGNKIDLNKSFAELPENHKKIVLHGDNENLYSVKGPNRFGRIVTWDTTFEGVIPMLERRYAETESDFVRGEIEKFMRIDICDECQGSRLKKEALSITVGESTIAQISEYSINGFLVDVGLDYLTISRSANTLAGG